MKQGGVKCRTERVKSAQKLSRIRSRLNLPSKDDFAYSKNYGSGIPAFVLREPKKDIKMEENNWNYLKIIPTL